MTAIRDCNEIQFLALLEGLAQDIVDAHIYWNYWKDIHAELSAWPDVAKESNSFWHYTKNAYLQTALASLARAYDQKSNSLHLTSWLKTIRANLPIFSKSSYERRLIDDPFAKWLLDDVKEPDIDVLENDIKSCSKRSSEVAALIRYRGGVLAHRGVTLVLNPAETQRSILDLESVEILLDRAKEILNRYAMLFMASAYSTKPVGYEDFKALFRYVQSALITDREKIEAQVASLAQSITPQLAHPNQVDKPYS